MMVAAFAIALLGCLAVGHAAAPPECSLNGEKKGGVLTPSNSLSAFRSALSICLPAGWRSASL